MIAFCIGSYALYVSKASFSVEGSQLGREPVDGLTA
jgi:hypothetical protein